MYWLRVAWDSLVSTSNLAIEITVIKDVCYQVWHHVSSGDLTQVSGLYGQHFTSDCLSPPHTMYTNEVHFYHCPNVICRAQEHIRIYGSLPPVLRSLPPSPPYCVSLSPTASPPVLST